MILLLGNSLMLWGLSLKGEGQERNSPSNLSQTYSWQQLLAASLLWLPGVGTPLGTQRPVLGNPQRSLLHPLSCSHTGPSIWGEHSAACRTLGNFLLTLLAQEVWGAPLPRPALSEAPAGGSEGSPGPSFLGSCLMPCRRLHCVPCPG